MNKGGGMAGGPGEMGMLALIDRALTLVSAAQAWFLAQPMLLQIVVGAVALAVLWVLWIVLRVTLVALRAAFRGL